MNQFSSPAYILDEEKLRKNLSLIKTIQDQSGAQFILSLKGFAWWKTFSIFQEYITGGSASSTNEIQLLQETNFKGIHTCIPAIKQQALNNVIKGSSHVSANSMTQFQSLLDKNNDGHCSLGIRVNIEYSETKTQLYNAAAKNSRFGIAIDELDVLNDEVEGIHFHSMCEAGIEEIERTLKVFENKCQHILSKVKWVNFGGGHLVTKDGFDVDRYIQLIKGLKDRYALDVFVEPSSAFLWDCGTLHTTIIDIVEKGGLKTAIMDVSFTAHMPDCIEMPYQPEILGAIKSSSTGDYVYSIGGNTCLAGDFIGNWDFGKPLNIGDVIIFKDMIHYTTVKSTMFNGIDHPDLILKTKQGFEVLRKFNFSDYKHRMC